MPPPRTPRNRSVDLTTLYNERNGHNPARAPPNSPASAYSLSPRSTRERHYTSLNQELAEPSNPVTCTNLNLPHGVDFRSLTYVGNVDENLVCPICRVAFVDPVDTECDHTFCRECITQALSHSETCPIDRYHLSVQAPLSRPHKIIINQIDALLVKCICCEAPVPRSMLQNHVERYCKDALVKCPGKTCEEVIKRKLSDKGCLHFDVICPDCDENHQQIDIGVHRESLCKEREKQCDFCGAEILRCKEAQHIQVCPDIIAPCKWAEYGCDYEYKRKDLPAHALDCTFKLVGPMADMLKKEIDVLRGEVRALTEKDQLQERRIKFLESGQKDSYRTFDYSEMPSQAVTSLPDSTSTEPLDSTNEYLLSLVEALESRVSQLSTGTTELEAKQTMMLFNETLPIKNELAEMRSQQQVVSMHVRWLLNFRRQENQRRFGGGGGPGASSGPEVRGSSADSSLPRRLSDSITRDDIARL